ncbi:MAG: cardiolipin synthase [Anaeromicrobium sp.]|uniref:cardiolipin synthase n=1 Tax=Anaeromicrobium sp. TaxID=1929132 RepID=UPI0025EDE339|nr:cardiolipin synthase [Anaeromicrobium sp.]MCT4592837.1 cardiolipin synthase [Anaeromicrobium sp.]
MRRGKSGFIILIIISFIVIIAFQLAGSFIKIEIKHLYTGFSTSLEDVGDRAYSLSAVTEYLNILFSVYIMFLALFIFLESRDPSRTVAWLLVLIAFPLPGFIFYLFMGQDIRKKRIFKKKKESGFPYFKKAVDIQKETMKYVDLFSSDESIVKKRLINLMINNANAPFTLNNKAKILTNGEETFNEIIKELKGAKSHIHMEYFIIKDDKIGRKIFNILKEKSKEGIKVRVIYDSVGSFRLSKNYLNELRDYGIEIEGFLPVYFPLLSRELNYRNHRKIIVIDGKIGFLGGLNIGDEYLGLNETLGFWRDSHLKVRGEAVYGLQNIFQRDWLFVTENTIAFDEEYYPSQGYCGEHLMQIAASGPDSDWQSIMQGYFCIISSAEKRIWINTPYLVPGESIMTALKTAALSGVDVRIILPHKPDHKTVFWASMSNVEELLEAGVKVYQYRKGFIHAKIMLVDGIAASVGTANLDIRSFRLNFEVNAFIYDEELVSRMEKDFKEDMEHSKEIILEEHKNRNILSRLKESTGKLFSPLL